MGGWNAAEIVIMVIVAMSFLYFILKVLNELYWHKSIFGYHQSAYKGHK